jgi:hypothetical protein
MAQNGQFNKSNWSRLAGDPKAIVYLPQAQSKGIVAQTISANATVVLTFSVPFQFKGNGPVEANFPFGQFFQNSTGQPSLDEVWLTQGTAYSNGLHPSINIRVMNAGTAACTITAGSDLLITQY